MKNEFTELFTKINDALAGGQSDATFIEDSMFALMGLIIDAGDLREFQSERNSAIKLLETLEEFSSGDKLLQPYLCAVILYFYSDERGAASVKPITEKEKVRIQELPLYEIRRRFPELGERLRDIVFDKYTDNEGYHISAQSGFRSKNKLDFQIDHIEPMAHGGLTVPDNLQLLRRDENMSKSDK